MPLTPPVQSTSATSLTNSASQISATLNGTAAGNTLIVCVAVGGVSTNPYNNVVLAVSDNQGNTYQAARGPDISDYNQQNVNQQKYMTWYVPNIPGGSVTVTVTAKVSGVAATQNWVIFLLEYSGILTFDQGSFGWRSNTGLQGIGTGTHFASSTGLDSAATPSTTHATEVCVACGGDMTGDQATYTALLSYVNEIHFSSGGFSAFVEDLAVSSIGVQEAKATSSVNTEWALQLSTFSSPPPPTNQVHSADVYIAAPSTPFHFADVYVNALGKNVHGADVYINPAKAINFVQLADNLIPPIVDPNAFVKLADNLLQGNLAFTQLATNLQAQAVDFVKLTTNLVVSARSFVKLATQLLTGGFSGHSADVLIIVPQLSFVQLATTLAQPLVPFCSGFPDTSFVKLQTWLVNPPNLTNAKLTDSRQAPGAGLTVVDDWLSQTDAAGAYSVVSRFVLNGYGLIVTGFTAGVISYQTRTRQWLRRVDFEAGGVVISTQTQTHKLPNGQTTTTVTTTKQVQDTTIVTTVTTYSSSNRITTSITETNRAGQTTTREIDTVTTNGVQVSRIKKVVNSTPPTKDNVQPIIVRTLDGIEHFQFFGQPNTEWAGGDQEGTTQTDKTVQIIPSQLPNGNTADQFGNPIMARITDEQITTPDGKFIETQTTEVGTNVAGSTVTDTVSSFNGIVTTVQTKVTFPDGHTEINTKVTNAITGDSTETQVVNATDENGLATITTTVTETRTFPDPVVGVRQQITRTTTVQGPNGTTTDVVTTSRNNFEDDIIGQKVKVYLVQEFTLNCVMDRFTMEGLLEIQIGHQKNFSILELLGQQLGNADLSWALRQNLISQYNKANNCLIPVQLQALGKTYMVVFASSAASFRAKYIPGTQPAIFEVQMILQERSDVLTGIIGF